jgi:tRNA-dihydrouridine synthase B
VRDWLIEHLHDHYSLYGERAGVRTARKHIGWAVHDLPGGRAFRQHMNLIESTAAQAQAVQDFLGALADTHPSWPQAAVPVPAQAA